MGLDDLQASDEEVDSDSSFDADAVFTFEDGEDARDRDCSSFGRRLLSLENRTSCCFLNSLLLMLFSSDVTCACIQDLPNPGPIISELKCLLNLLIRNGALQHTCRLQEAHTQKDAFQDWLEEN
jgi:hypothetical protein